MKESKKYYLKKIVALGLGGYIEKVIRLHINTHIQHFRNLRQQIIIKKKLKDLREEDLQKYLKEEN